MFEAACFAAYCSAGVASPDALAALAFSMDVSGMDYILVSLAIADFISSFIDMSSSSWAATWFELFLGSSGARVISLCYLFLLKGFALGTSLPVLTAWL